MTIQPTKARGRSAHTKFPNTPETDKLEFVWHIVTDACGVEHEILAREPGEAIDMFNKDKPLF